MSFLFLNVLTGDKIFASNPRYIYVATPPQAVCNATALIVSRLLCCTAIFNSVIFDTKTGDPDVIASMPLNDRYEYVKAKIINHFADSEQRRLNRLLSELPLGDRKPSELFYEMKRVAGSTLGEAAVKSL